MSMSLAILPVFTATSPLASMDGRSATFSTAFGAVAVHTPASQLMFCVGLLEIVTSACAAIELEQRPRMPAAPANARRFKQIMLTSLAACTSAQYGRFRQ